MENELNYYYNDQNDPFESALSSMVSSPTMGGGVGSNGGDLMMELIGRLGSITESNSTNTSCYTTPLSSPPKAGVNLLNYPPGLALPLHADPGFVERAAKFTSFRSGVNLECGKLSRVSSSQLICDNGDGSREGSSVSEQNQNQNQNQNAVIGQMSHIDVNSRKRKCFSKSKGKDEDNKVEQENNNEKVNAKRSKNDDQEGKNQNGGGESNGKITSNSNGKEVKKAEPPKDYIHVRARRGQATDSHSLAERVRREKISERMKFLQDLVPGCNKVTGKATVLDEIINYVQSLQRQVEFLSMKLANFNPRTEFTPESLLSKDMFQAKGLSTMPQIMYQLDQNSTHGYQPFQQLHSPFANGNENPFSSSPSDVAEIRRHLSGQFPSSITQMPNFWEDDLQSIVQMGIVQNQAQSLHGTSPNDQMKVEQ